MHFEKRQKVLRDALDSTHSSFYRNFCRKKLGDHIDASFPNSESAWETLPLLEKGDLTTVPFTERLFVPYNEVLSLRTTSGTSGKEILLVPRSHIKTAYFKHFIYLSSPRMQSLLSFFYPHSIYSTRCSEAGIRYTGGDIGNINVSIALGKLANVDSFIVTPSILVAILPILEEQRMLEQITFIEMWGERCSDAHYKLFTEKFPNATLFHEYGSSELNGITGIPCLHILNQKKGWIHPVGSDYYFELLDEDMNVISEVEKEGEIIITTLWDNNALPMIRYRTGDVGEIVSHTCTCGSPYPVYKISGRKHLDRIRIAGGEIKIEEVERVIGLFNNKIGNDFELHYYTYTKKSGGEIKPEIILKVQPHTSALNLVDLALAISQKFHTSPTFTYADGVAQNLYEPLKCVLLNPRQYSNKTVRIIQHT